MPENLCDTIGSYLIKAKPHQIQSSIFNHLKVFKKSEIPPCADGTDTQTYLHITHHKQRILPSLPSSITYTTYGHGPRLAGVGEWRGGGLVYIDISHWNAHDINSWEIYRHTHHMRVRNRLPMSVCSRENEWFWAINHATYLSTNTQSKFFLQIHLRAQTA